MIETIIIAIGLLIAFAIAIGSTAIIRSHGKLHQGIDEIKQECARAHIRIDTTGTRVDNTFQALMSYITKR